MSTFDVIVPVDFTCLSQNFEEREDFNQCLRSIQRGYKDSQYVDVDDICRFLQKIKKHLFDFMERLNPKGDIVGISSILENVFNILLYIHNETKMKVDLLQEFNTIHEILDTYDEIWGLKMKLNTLKEVYEQCRIYQDRPIDELEKAKEKRTEDRISKEDYNFLNE